MRNFSPVTISYLSMGLAWILWSLDPIFIRLIGDDVARPVISGGALMIGGLLLIAPALKGYPALLHRKDLWGACSFYVIFSTVLADLLYVIAVRNLNPGIVCLLMRSQIVMAIIGGWLAFHEKPGKATRLGVLIVILGYAANAWFSIAKSTEPSRNPLLGWLCGIAAAILWTFGTLLGKKLTESLKSSQLSGVRMLSAGLITVVAYCCLGGARDFTVLSCNQWMLLCVKAALGSGLAFVLYLYGLHLSSVTAAAAMEQAAPLCALFISTVFLHEAIPCSQWLAIAIVFIGATVILIDQYRNS